MFSRWLWQTRRLPAEGISQLRALIEAYHRLRASSTGNFPGEDAEVAAIEQRLNDQPNTLWWTDVAQADLCTLPLLSDADLRAHLVGWRRRFREVAGEARYSQYLTGASAPGAPIDHVRADLAEGIRSVYYFYAAYGLAAHSRTVITQWMLWIALLIVLLEAAVGYAFSFMPGAKGVVEFALATSFFAILGSIVSVQRRLQDPSISVDPLYQYIQGTADRLSIALVSPLFGAIFGIIMYGLIRSQLVLANLVKFSDKAPAAPNSTNDAALLFVMGFVAGFAEQLIPDAISRIAARALSGVTGGTTPPPTSTPVPPPSPPPTTPPPTPTPSSGGSPADASPSPPPLGASEKNGDGQPKNVDEH